MTKHFRNKKENILFAVLHITPIAPEAVAVEIIANITLFEEQLTNKLKGTAKWTGKSLVDN